MRETPSGRGQQTTPSLVKAEVRDLLGNDDITLGY